ncbi:hypothetical protein YDYSY3_38790 [Paenibacillus chitinolyticus]|uniref:hypothetical protein n=1 Tax=Paenibacillus chitinolyticus TaxID=79263 RepID=UPI0026E4C48A|nr:hypothetical protein [Paenibacillus chitinolyticus]GKS12879.1 hypothetical protein YDYSY3_38790 [Paenibacillus chitinolyticus]
MTDSNHISKEPRGNEIVIRFRDFGLPIVEEYANGIKLGEGLHTHEALAGAIFHSRETVGCETPILPRGAIQYSHSEDKSRTFCFLEMAPQNRDIFYHEAKITDVPFPRLVFGFELIKKEQKFIISEVMVCALEEECLANEDAEVYNYPYSNVDNHKVCWGGSRLPDLDRVSQLSTIPELFFNSPNSDCYYSSANVSGKNYRELVETLKNKSFPDKYLKNTGLKLSAWINQRINPFK